MFSQTSPKKKSSTCKSIIIQVVVNTIFGVMILPLIKVINIFDSTKLHPHHVVHKRNQYQSPVLKT